MMKSQENQMMPLNMRKLEEDHKSSHTNMELVVGSNGLIQLNKENGTMFSEFKFSNHQQIDISETEHSHYG